MIVILQRVKKVEVIINKNLYSKINKGILIFLGINNSDNIEDINYLCKKITKLRIFSDIKNKMNFNIKDISGEIMVVSQFTLYGNCLKGNRPSFIKSAPKSYSEPLYEIFLKRLKEFQIPVKSGKFGVDMKVNLENDGPVTFVIESKNEK